MPDIVKRAPRAARQDVRILYRNHRGETAVRHITPREVVFGETTYHHGKQWLLNATDHDKGAVRTFAMTEILAWWFE